MILEEGDIAVFAQLHTVFYRPMHVQTEARMNEVCEMPVLFSHNCLFLDKILTHHTVSFSNINYYYQVTTSDS